MSLVLSELATALLGGTSAWCGGSWLGCQDLPAMGAVFIYELAVNSVSSWMFQAPNLHFSDAVVNNEIILALIVGMQCVPVEYNLVA